MAKLTPEQTSGFAAKLQQIKLQLESETGDVLPSAATVELDQQSVGRLSRMDALQAQQMALELARRRQHALVQINSALLRIAQNEYGYCQVCDEPTNPRRLEVNPLTRHCLKCADKN